MLNEKKVLEANDTFYRAFNSRDLELMKEVWRHDDAVVCLHPGWGVLRGFEAIIKSWSDIFRNSQNMDIRLSGVEVVISEDLAWVSCRENLYMITANGVNNSKVHATNLFKFSNHRWQMVLHHASSLPALPMEEEISSN